MPDIKASLTRKVGPLPAYGWAALIMLAIGGVYLWKKYTSAKGTTSTETGSLAAGDASSYDYSSSSPDSYGGDSGVGLGGGGGGTTINPSSNAPTTNTAWFTLAASYLQGFGYDAASIAQALNNFLLGNQASAQDRALFNLAVGKWGQPPEGIPPQPTPVVGVPPILPPGGGTPKPPGSNPPPSQPPPATHTYYTVASGDTLFGIARKVGVAESTLYANNAAVIEAAARAHGKTSSDNGHWIYPGTKLLVK